MGQKENDQPRNAPTQVAPSHEITTATIQAVEAILADPYADPELQALMKDVKDLLGEHYNDCIMGNLFESYHRAPPALKQKLLEFFLHRRHFWPGLNGIAQQINHRRTGTRRSTVARHNLDTRSMPNIKNVVIPQVSSH